MSRLKKKKKTEKLRERPKMWARHLLLEKNQVDPCHYLWNINRSTFPPSTDKQL